MKYKDRILLEEYYRIVCEDIGSGKLYHGNRKGDFPPAPDLRRFAGAIFLTYSLNFAKSFAGCDEPEKFPNRGIWEVKLKPGLKIFDPSDDDMVRDLDLKSIIQKLIDSKYVDPVTEATFKEVNERAGLPGYDSDTNTKFKIQDKSQSVYYYLWRVKNKGWAVIECAPIIEAIKSKSYDGFESIEMEAENVAVFDENSIQGYAPLPLTEVC